MRVTITDEMRATARRHVDVNRDAIDQCYERMPARLAYWSEQYALAYAQSMRDEMGYKDAKAKSYLFHKLTMTKESDKKPTQADISAKVDSDESVLEAWERHCDGKCTMMWLKGQVEAVQAATEMVRSMGARIREEMRSLHMDRTKRS